MKETRFYLNMTKLSLAYRILQMINLMKIYFLIKIMKMRKKVSPQIQNLNRSDENPAISLNHS